MDLFSLGSSSSPQHSPGHEKPDEVVKGEIQELLAAAGWGREQTEPRAVEEQRPERDISSNVSPVSFIEIRP